MAHRVNRVLGLPVPVLAVLGLAGVAAAAAGFVVAVPGPSPGVAPTALLAVAFTPFAVFLLRRRPGHPVGRLMLLTGTTAAAATAAVGWSAALPAAWLGQWLWLPAWSAIPAALLLTPDGTSPSRRWRPLTIVLGAAATVLTAAVAVAAAYEPRTLLSSGQPITGAARPWIVAARVAAAVLGVATLGVVAALAVRWARADPTVRGQLACVLPVGVLLVAGVALDTANVPLAWLPAVVALPVGLTVAVLRHELHDLDLHVHRATVWTVLAGLAVTAYVGATALAGAVLPSSPLGPAVAAGVVAAALAPGHWLVQRAIRRMVYGRRGDPYAVLSELGRHLESVRDPLAVLPEIAATVVASLRVPYTALRVVEDDGRLTTTAERGRWVDGPARFPMAVHGRPVGELVVAPRRAGTRFTAAETALLRDLAGRAALAVDACRSAVALRAARERLVAAREEERRRLRRELHDGVASALVGTRLLVEAARRTVPGDGPAPGILDALATDLGDCSDEVRGLIDGLRPAALDDGLAAALKGLLDRFGDRGPEITLDTGPDPDGLPAAVEVAAYRIVTETLTNVVRHAQARSAAVQVRRDDRHLEITVTDDGHGIAPEAAEGVGIGSVRARAEELGGRATVRSGPRGTVVEVLLPLRDPG